MANISSINGNPITMPENSINDGMLVLDGGILERSDYLDSAINETTEHTANINTAPLGRWVYSMTTGERTVDHTGNRFGMRYPVKCEPNTKYKVCNNGTSGTYILFYDSNKEFISSYSSAGDSSTGYWYTFVTTPDMCEYIAVFVYYSGGIDFDDSSRISIEKLPWNSFVSPFNAIDAKARENLELIYHCGMEATRNINTSPVGMYQVRASGSIDKSQGTTFGMKNAVPCDPETTYTITFKDGGVGSAPQMYVGYYDEYGVLIERVRLTPNALSNTFETPEGCAFVAGHVYRAAASGGANPSDGAGIQIEKGLSATTYVPPYTMIDLVARGMKKPYPDYFADNVSQAIDKVRANMLSVGRNGDTFVFITDCHWRNNKQSSPALIRDVLENTNVRLVINGGDNLQGHLNPKASAATEILTCVNAFNFDDLGVVSVGVMGNHDNNQNNNSSNPQEYISTTEQYSIINKAYESNLLHYGTDGNWYYFDNDVAKVRYLMLDWGGDSIQQAAWITETMNALPCGYKAVVVIHGIYRTTAGDQTHAFILERGYVLDACEPYKEDILFFIQGHTHWDGVVAAYENDTTPIIVTTCDTYAPEYGSVAGTITEQCFDVVTFDYVEGTINCVRVGRGEDRLVSM